jgi:hypothetical protein
VEESGVINKFGESSTTNDGEGFIGSISALSSTPLWQ